MLFMLLWMVDIILPSKKERLQKRKMILSQNTFLYLTEERGEGPLVPQELVDKWLESQKEWVSVQEEMEQFYTENFLKKGES